MAYFRVTSENSAEYMSPMSLQRVNTHSYHLELVLERFKIHWFRSNASTVGMAAVLYSAQSLKVKKHIMRVKLNFKEISSILRGP